MNLSHRIALLRLKQKQVMILADAVGDKHKWITTESGSHIKVDGDGNIVSGAGGKFNGKPLSSMGGNKKFTKYETNAERAESAKQPNNDLQAKHKQKAQELAKQKTEWSGGNYEENLASAKAEVQEIYQKQIQQKISHKPDLSIKDVKIGDEIYFPRDGIQGGYGGVVKNIYRSKMDLEGDYMGKPILLEKKGFMKNGTIKRGNELIISDKNRYDDLKKERASIGIESDDPQSAPEVKPSEKVTNN